MPIGQAAGGPGEEPSSPRPSTLPPTPLSELLVVSGARAAAGPPVEAKTVSGVELRAQHVVDGDLFAALPGARAHGASFIPGALARGAAAILTDEAGLAHVSSDIQVPVLVHDEPRRILGDTAARIYGNPSDKLQLIGITGTSGKTTTAYLIEGGLVAAGLRAGLIGTVETRIEGKPVPSALTTPEAPQLQALLAVMAERGIDSVVMEVSSHALALGRVDGCHFAVGGFTNLSHDHLDFHRDMEDYFDTKARLFVAESRVKCERAVICVDDDWGRRMADCAEGDVVTVSADGHPAQWLARSAHVVSTGVQAFAAERSDGRQYDVTVRLPGRYNVANALLALAILDAAGANTTQAARGLADVQVPGRVERIDRGQPFLAVVDYAHKPGAVEAVLATLRAQARGKIALVIGAGGNRDTGKRQPMGEASARGSDVVIITDDNPRDEDSSAIRAEMLAGARRVPEAERAEIQEIGDRAKAIRVAVEWVAAHGIGDDVVLVAGKGHETGQEIRGVKHPFDDRLILADAIDAALRSEVAE
ncbi:UDP-N-acetylmuramoylalanyl-D-glutamate--2,6-diaminopimelate ligase [Hoyosella subflava DQS3-9A1]|uniref:UDP-N-acetylmuramoyl-L-alanyl-D-glutamate--2,6-diaminopimelate ligase n=1 Tax=Hoyosella subflava (strain DSM 45089 / JCM 17490 / NBRC 109087 / DQS3-9A1) TaxID=443218 RepID=F6EFG1_HOYSD|nr:UDP-N-acetylmuramoylalanyl-D-glutamate--2,6-diaminopimelate ligase [Hoyosella subflava DQS3-9A1]